LAKAVGVVLSEHSGELVVLEANWAAALPGLDCCKDAHLDSAPQHPVQLVTVDTCTAAEAV